MFCLSELNALMIQDLFNDVFGFHLSDIDYLPNWSHKLNFISLKKSV